MVTGTVVGADVVTGAVVVVVVAGLVVLVVVELTVVGVIVSALLLEPQAAMISVAAATVTMNLL
ncbi:MAG TPA: hypothetical protein ENH15_00295 [Actinobacteria bacterium]|nr:hypothetical protein [Actinomycetota bacterium]